MWPFKKKSAKEKESKKQSLEPKMHAGLRHIDDLSSNANTKKFNPPEQIQPNYPPEPRLPKPQFLQSDIPNIEKKTMPGVVKELKPLPPPPEIDEKQIPKPPVISKPEIRQEKSKEKMNKKEKIEIPSIPKPEEKIPFEEIKKFFEEIPGKKEKMDGKTTEIPDEIPPVDISFEEEIPELEDIGIEEIADMTNEEKGYMEDEGEKFIDLQSYKEIVIASKDIKNDSMESKEFLHKTDKLKEVNDSAISVLNKKIEDIERKLLYVDKRLFDKVI